MIFARPRPARRATPPSVVLIERDGRAKFRESDSNEDRRGAGSSYGSTDRVRHRTSRCCSPMPRPAPCAGLGHPGDRLGPPAKPVERDDARGSGGISRLPARRPYAEQKLPRPRAKIYRPMTADRPGKCAPPRSAAGAALKRPLADRRIRAAEVEIAVARWDEHRRGGSATQEAEAAGASVAAPAAMADAQALQECRRRPCPATLALAEVLDLSRTWHMIWQMPPRRIRWLCGWPSSPARLCAGHETARRRLFGTTPASAIAALCCRGPRSNRPHDGDAVPPAICRLNRPSNNLEARGALAGFWARSCDALRTRFPQPRSACAVAGRARFQ